MTQFVHLAGWQKIAWALDEDLRWAQAALRGSVNFTSLPAARIVLAAWWPAIEAIGLPALRGKTVVCFADNPPAFYLTRPGFSAVAARVDLWIARSREALWQFQALGLPVARVPYCVDTQIFRPLEKPAAIRQELGIPEGAFVVGNFHRDSEGSDLGRPKMQKGADILLEIVRALHRRVPQTQVLLAGPRRHWLLGQLESAGIPHCFAGQKPDAADDYARNILDRPELNRLYQALDVCVVSSRWEGGPYSILEALLAGRPAISTPVGIARDLLPEGALYREPEDAVNLLESQVLSGALEPSARAGRKMALEQNSLDALRASLGEIFASLPDGAVSFPAAAGSAMQVALTRVRQPVWHTKRPSVEAVAALVDSAPGRGCFFAAEHPDPLALAESACGIRNALTP